MHHSIYSSFSDCPLLTIYGYSGSSAESYAKRNGISFVALDAEDDGEWTVTYYPSAETQQEGYVVPFETDEPEQTEVPGDVNGDGILDISDAIFLARFVAEDTALDLSNFNAENADANGDGLTTAADTVYIIQKIAKLI